MAPDFGARLGPGETEWTSSRAETAGASGASKLGGAGALLAISTGAVAGRGPGVATGNADTGDDVGAEALLVGVERPRPTAAQTMPATSTSAAATHTQE